MMKFLISVSSLISFPLISHALDIDHGDAGAGTAACARLATYNSSITIFPNTTEYNTEEGSYWTLQNTEIYPSCRFIPSCASEISVAIKTIVGTNSKFAIKSGGHSVNPGANNIQNGVTFDFHVNMKGKAIYQVLNDTNAIVKVEAGAKWVEIYEYLEPLNWMVVGGRLSDIGAGGFLLGGGISHYGPRKGWGSDNVMALDVVLSSGTIVHASKTENGELFWAMRGGGNRFGIVVAYYLLAFKQTNLLWGGTILIDPSNITAAIDALAVFNKNSVQDDGCTAELPFSWTQAAPNASAIIFLINSYGRNDSALLQPIIDMAAAPLGTAALTYATMSEWAIELFTTDPPVRYAQSVLTFQNDPVLLNGVVDLFGRLIQPLIAADPNLKPASMHQPVPSAVFTHMTDSPIYLDPSMGDPVMIHFLSWSWTDSSKDEYYKQTLKNFTVIVENYAKSQSGLHPWLYMNYAASYQDVYASYGEQHVERMRRVVDLYDPMRVMQRLQAPSFQGTVL